MRPATARKLAEVEASYRLATPAAHRCGLQTCQEDGECGFPTRCVALPSDLSPDVPEPLGRRVSETEIASGIPAECANCGSRESLADIQAGKAYTSCCPEREMRAIGPDRDRTIGLDERMWRAEGHANGWTPPERRVWWKRLWIIRHVSALVLSWKVHTYAGGWAAVGIGIGGPHPQDLWVVEGAYHGYW